MTLLVDVSSDLEIIVAVVVVVVVVVDGGIVVFPVSLLLVAIVARELIEVGWNTVLKIKMLIVVFLVEKRK